MGLFSSIIAIIFGLAAVTAGVVTVASRDPVRSVIALIGVMTSVGVVFLALGSYFIGLLQLFVFSTLIFFIVIRKAVRMPTGESRRDSIPSTRILGLIVTAIFFIILVSTIISSILTGSTFPAPASSGLNLVALRDLGTGWIYMLGLLIMLALASYIASRCLRQSDSSDPGSHGGEA